MQMQGMDVDDDTDTLKSIQVELKNLTGKKEGLLTSLTGQRSSTDSENRSSRVSANNPASPEQKENVKSAAKNVTNGSESVKKRRLNFSSRKKDRETSRAAALGEAGLEGDGQSDCKQS